jgi:hypothetical protein
MTVGGFLDGILKLTDRIPTVWNVAVVFRVQSVVSGVRNIIQGVMAGNSSRVGTGAADVASALPPKTAGLLIDAAKVVMSVALPLNATDQKKLLEFRATVHVREERKRAEPVPGAADSRALLSRWNRECDI